MPTGNKTASPYIIGVPVPPTKFYGYDDQVAQFFRQCICGPVLQPTRILGLRRSGKTSFLKYISSACVPQESFNDINREELVFVYLDLEFISSPANFFCEVAEAINENCSGPEVQPQELTTAYSFSKWLRKFFAAHKDKKLIILLDEFEGIHASPNFDWDFFGFLRSLASSHAEHLTWVTASVIDLHTLDKNEKTSPLWNIFRNTPITMCGLDRGASEKLVREPALKQNVKFSKEEISEILRIAGSIPYFIQATADEWFRCKTQSLTRGKIKNRIFEVLSASTNQAEKILRGYWNEMSEEKKNILTDIAIGRRNISQNSNALQELADYGLVKRENNGVTLSGELLKQHILNASVSGKAAPSTPAQPGVSRPQVEPKGTAATPAINVFIDSKIGQMRQNTTDHSVVNTNGTYIDGNVNITNGSFAGRDMSNQTGLDDAQIQMLFESLFAKIDSHPQIPQHDKADIKLEIEEVRQELAKQEQANEAFIIRRLRNIGRMAPDILEVTLTTLANPAAGFGMVAKKVAEKIRSTAG